MAISKRLPFLRSGISALLILGILGTFQFVPFYFHASVGPMASLSHSHPSRTIGSKVGWKYGTTRVASSGPQALNAGKQYPAANYTYGPYDKAPWSPGVQILDDTCMPSAEQTENQKPVYVSNS
jgi:hypothetical protein